jgi:EAL domain-containing protein (putative c-di-GMP-specific phosphodiesterase class I)
MQITSDRQPEGAKPVEPEVPAAEKRRPGRAKFVSPALIPVLRGALPTVSEGFPLPAAAAGRSPSGSHRPQSKACAACKDGSALFSFSMAFQPIVDLHNNRIDAYEALVRGPAGEGANWVLGQVTPENTYSFDQACRVKAIEWAARLGVDRQLSINFLPNAVYEPRACIQTTLRAAARTGFPRERLTFEILESETIADTAHLLAIIREYRNQGFKIALDDFGTGYSGLARLAELRPDIVKVDRVLVQDCDRDQARLAIIAGIIAIGKAIDVKIVLEGVEREGEVEALRSVGARFIQGFYFARPQFEGVAREGDIDWRPRA